MKKIFLIAAGLSLGVATTSCSLEKFPETMYAENNTSGTGDSETAINCSKASLRPCTTT